ncbi:hypothetical protein MX569_09475, partial [Anoxybacillus kestanbolensis]|uniref:hypothetical protein n=1 Tax=Anoxybacillus kestanbolensis TaxID=227476 RepID=UPI00208DCA92
MNKKFGACRTFLPSFSLYRPCQPHSTKNEYSKNPKQRAEHHELKYNVPDVHKINSFSFHYTLFFIYEP